MQLVSILFDSLRKTFTDTMLRQCYKLINCIGTRQYFDRAVAWCRGREVGQAHHGSSGSGIRDTHSACPNTMEGSSILASHPSMRYRGNRMLRVWRIEQTHTSMCIEVYVCRSVCMRLVWVCVCTVQVFRCMCLDVVRVYVCYCVAVDVVCMLTDQKMLYFEFDIYIRLRIFTLQTNNVQTKDVCVLVFCTMHPCIVYAIPCVFAMICQ